MSRGYFSAISYYKRRYNKAKEEGMCVRCRKNKARAGMLTCGCSNGVK